mmetsp:Transcript_13356/g.32953  ORF Transcript_13356/g.32953 Transcript_13356/m.32953 type:complete len:157 (+) Transcript_13356:67-537(+)
MRLIHRTNYYGKFVEPRSRGDDSVPFEALWVQATDDGDSCCYGFGRREIEVTGSLIWSFHSGYWNLWFVEKEQGYADEFYKFALVPEGIPGYGKAKLYQRGWRNVSGPMLARNLMGMLEDVLDSYWDEDTHCHIAIHTNGQGISTSGGPHGEAQLY